VHDALQRLGIPPALERVMLVNGADAAADRRLLEADVIDVFPPLAGGSYSLGGVVAARWISESISAPTSSTSPLR
jgi:hypothetical protein